MSRINNHPGWQWCTADGAELHTLLEGLHTPFREKLLWLEEAESLAIRMRPCRETSTATEVLFSGEEVPHRRPLGYGGQASEK
jgi:hypothetical protein